ncbi:hypothetical protein [Nocardia niigatensis]|uniref:hypothetical protein n=1 Tax=Nocardia niigatensis TaxID=209249 RepID=UPI0002DC8965|nr:hypothetical protein [Nocardia niigatensis]
MSMLVRIGLLELAAGALLGWVVAAEHAAPQRLRRIGLVHPRRILQAHLDYVIMGLILVTVGVAAPGLPGWAAALVVTGTLLNPTLFLPLAFHDRLRETLPYRVVSAFSFLATSLGLVTAALYPSY